jgi:hypothetical protein
VADKPRRKTADLSQYPDLVVINLGMRVDEQRAYEPRQTARGRGPQRRTAVAPAN